MKALKNLWRHIKLAVLRLMYPKYYVEFLGVLSTPTAHQLFYDIDHLVHIDRKIGSDASSPVSVSGTGEFDPCHPSYVTVKVHPTEDGKSEAHLKLNRGIYSYEASRLVQGRMALKDKEVYSHASEFIREMIAKGDLIVAGHRVYSAAEGGPK